MERPIGPSGPDGAVQGIRTVILERLLQNLALRVDPFATCSTATGWRLRFPSWDRVTFHFVMRGEGRLSEASGRVEEISPSTLVVVPPHHPHSLESGVVGRDLLAADAPTIPSSPPHLSAGPPDDPDSLCVACGRVEVTYGSTLGLFDRLDECLVLDFSDSEQMRAVFSGLMREQRQDRPGRETMMASLMNQCLVLVFRRLSRHEEVDLPWVSALEDPRWAAIVDEVLAHPDRPHTVESLALVANMSRSAFARRFRETFGRPPMSYVREVRLRHAARMLQDPGELSIEAISHRVGFESRSQFSRAFHQLFGCPPAQFRLQTG